MLVALAFRIQIIIYFYSSCFLLLASFIFVPQRAVLYFFNLNNGNSSPYNVNVLLTCSRLGTSPFGAIIRLYVLQHCLLVFIANLYLVFINSSFMTTGIKSI